MVDATEIVPVVSAVSASRRVVVREIGSGTSAEYRVSAAAVGAAVGRQAHGRSVVVPTKHARARMLRCMVAATDYDS